MISLDALLFLRKKKFWIAFSAVLVVAVLIFVNLTHNNTDEYRKLHAFSINYKNDDQSLVIEDDAYLSSVENLGNTLEKSVLKKDWQTINSTLTDVYLLQAKKATVLSNPDNADLYYHDYMRYRGIVDALIKQRKLPMLTKEMFEMENDFGFTSYEGYDETLLYPYYQFQARFYHELEKQDIDQLTYSTVDSSTVFVQFIRAMFPLLPIIMIGIMCFDALQEDRDSGIIKVLLSQPLKRSCYIKKKILLNIKSVLCIFFIPLIVLSLGCGLFDHYKTRKAPVMANVQGITSLHTMENTLPDIMRQHGNTGSIGITKYFAIPIKSQSPNVKFDFMEMWQFVGLCIFMAVLVLVFIVLMNMFISVIVKNKIAALVVSLSILLTGMFFASPSNVGQLYAYLPITFMNPVDILSGYSTYTYLNGIVILVLGNILLYAAIVYIYKRKDEVC